MVKTAVFANSVDRWGSYPVLPAESVGVTGGFLLFWALVCRVLRWSPFLFILAGLAMLAEVGIYRRSFMAHYGAEAWNMLHFYGSAVLVVAAYAAQSHKRPMWSRLVFAMVVVLAVGLLREVRQYYDIGPRGFSRHDIKSDVQGTLVGAAVCIYWRFLVWRRRRGRKRV